MSPFVVIDRGLNLEYVEGSQVGRSLPFRAIQDFCANDSDISRQVVTWKLLELTDDECRLRRWSVRFARDPALLTFARRIPGLKRETWGTPHLVIRDSGMVETSTLWGPGYVRSYCLSNRRSYGIDHRWRKRRAAPFAARCLSTRLSSDDGW